MNDDAYGYANALQASITEHQADLASLQDEILSKTEGLKAKALQMAGEIGTKFLADNTANVLKYGTEKLSQMGLKGASQAISDYKSGGVPKMVGNAIQRRLGVGKDLNKPISKTGDATRPRVSAERPTAERPTTEQPTQPTQPTAEPTADEDDDIQRLMDENPDDGQTDGELLSSVEEINRDEPAGSRIVNPEFEGEDADVEPTEMEETALRPSTTPRDFNAPSDDAIQQAFGVEEGDLDQVGASPFSVKPAFDPNVPFPEVEDGYDDYIASLNAGLNEGENVLDTAGGDIDNAINTASGAVDSAIDEASGAVDSAIDTASGALDSAVDTASGAVDSAVDTASGLVSSTIDTAVNTATNVASSAVDTATNLVSSAVNTATSAVGSAVDSASTAVSSAVGAGTDAVAGGLETAGVALDASGIGAIAGVVLGIGGVLASIFGGGSSTDELPPPSNFSYQTGA